MQNFVREDPSATVVLKDAVAHYFDSCTENLPKQLKLVTEDNFGMLYRTQNQLGHDR